VGGAVRYKSLVGGVVHCMWVELSHRQCACVMGRRATPMVGYLVFVSPPPTDMATHTLHSRIFSFSFFWCNHGRGN
jgi:hypothetical protein